jgi:hypothetical protein
MKSRKMSCQRMLVTRARVGLTVFTIFFCGGDAAYGGPQRLKPDFALGLRHD